MKRNQKGIRWWRLKCWVGTVGGYVDSQRPPAFNDPWFSRFLTYTLPSPSLPIFVWYVGAAGEGGMRIAAFIELGVCQPTETTSLCVAGAMQMKVPLCVLTALPFSQYRLLSLFSRFFRAVIGHTCIGGGMLSHVRAPSPNDSFLFFHVRSSSTPLLPIIFAVKPLFRFLVDSLAFTSPPPPPPNSIEPHPH